MIKNKGKNARAEVCVYDTGSCSVGSDRKEGWFEVNSLRSMASGGVYEVTSKRAGYYAYAVKKAVHVMREI